MKKLVTALCALILINCGSKPSKGALVGKWTYSLVMNGIPIGTSTISNEKKSDRFVSRVYMEMKAGQIVNTTEQIMEETLNYDPLKLSIVNTVQQGKNKEVIKTEALFDGRNIALNLNGTKRKIQVSKSFILDGNFFVTELKKMGFKKGSELTAYIYEPTLSSDELIPVKVVVSGTKKVKLKGKTVDLIHIVEVISGFKTVDIYVNKDGIMEKAEILMLNNRIELIRK